MSRVRPDWALASCAGSDYEAWFPESGLLHGHAARLAVKTCRSCPIQADCLQYAIDEELHYGIWGGVSAAERVRMAGRKRVA